MIGRTTAATELLRRLLLIAGVGALGASIAGCGETQCLQWSKEKGDCPTRAEAAGFIRVDCGDELASVDSDGDFDGATCCYEITTKEAEFSCCPEDGCVEGRPFVERGAPVTASAEVGAKWWITKDPPSACDLPLAVRAVLAASWTRAGLAEHASVASFARVSLELLAAGAPSELVALAHEAALDEVRHARGSFAMASRYRGEAIGPSRFPLGASIAVKSDLASLAEATFVEGCVGETVAALVAAEQARTATDEGARALLSGIAEDEARHAELAFRTVQWALREGGSRVRSALVRAAADLGRGLDPSAMRPAIEPGHARMLAAHGWLGEAARRAIARHAVAQVVRPALRALLGEAPPGPRPGAIPAGG